jgi:hypothetical protein
MDNERRHEFWQRFPGLAWSNPEASDAAMIRSALARPQTEQLRQIVEEFGIERVQSEWDILVDDPLCPYSATHISICNRILAVCAKDVLDYKQAIDSERNRVLDELAKQAQELGMGY